MGTIDIDLSIDTYWTRVFARACAILNEAPSLDANAAYWQARQAMDGREYRLDTPDVVRVRKHKKIS